ncbi:MAG: ComF family protein [Candidatus Gastranaerophilales bacterium]|nr:ComF family protein [Candidatus Gastranaerophilales bacterium]
MFLELRNIFSNFFSAFLMLIFNQKCVCCNCAKTEKFLCKTCLKDVHYLSSFAHKIHNNIPIFSATIYDKTVKKLIHKLKFQHKKQASVALAELLFNYFKNLELSNNKNLIIIYPSSNTYKSSYRGYEHMYLICNEFKKLSGLELKKNLIKKIKYTKPQHKATNKFKNIENSFKINYKNEKELAQLRKKPILLIDDIITSGATIQEIIKELNNVGINKIFVLTISKAGV